MDFSILPRPTDMEVVIHEHRQVYDALLRRVEKLLGDPNKARLWFQIKNPSLGDVQPMAMIALGKAHRLDKFIEEAEEATRL